MNLVELKNTFKYTNQQHVIFFNNMLFSIDFHVALKDIHNYTQNGEYSLKANFYIS